jgi:hypothetical protein
MEVARPICQKHLTVICAALVFLPAAVVEASVPSITSQPTSTNVLTGANATFKVTATGSPTPTYLWSFNGANLANNSHYGGVTTATLTVSNVTAADAGNYRVGVTNSHGGVVSSNATLTVLFRVHYVNAASTNPVAPYTNWSTAAQNIQNAVSASVAGDSVLVTNGYYNPGGTITVTIPITVASVSGPAVTVIDGAGAYRCVYLGGGATLTGFMLTNGYDSGYGGDAYCETPNERIVNCILTGGYAGVPINGVGGPGMGGGVIGGTVINSTLIGNHGSQNGGGAYASTLSNCVITANSADNYQGGGTYQCTLYNCTLTNNGAGQWGGNASESMVINSTVNTGNAFMGGGAINSTLIGCMMSGNTAYWGGAARFSTLSNCTLLANSGWSNGGGADSSGLNNCLVVSNYAAQGAGVSGCTLTNSVIQGNNMSDPYYGSGGGAYSSTLYNCLITGNNSVRDAGGADLSTLVNCTVTANSASGNGGGVNSSRLTNCIVYFNTAPLTANYSGTN